MFQTLLESRANRARGTWGTAVSVGVHTTAIALAIVATARATAAPIDAGPQPPDLVFTAPVLTRPPRPVAQYPDGGPLWLRKLPPIPIVVGTRIPRIDIPAPDFPVDPAAAVGKNPFEGAKPLTSCYCGQGAADSGATEGGLYTAPMVDKAAVPRPGNPAPTYPPALRAAQLEGSVTARFIVDTTGRAEPASIAFPEATHPSFTEAVRQSLLHSRYLPAIVAGHPVRQLVEQRFTFSLER